MSHFNDHLDSIVRQLQAGYNSNELFFNKNGLEHPNPSEIIDILNDFRQLLFPGYFGTDQPTRTSAPYFAGQMLHSIYERLYPQIRAALAGQPVVYPTFEQVVETAIRHGEMMRAWKQEHAAVTEMRKHMCWYIHGRRGAARLRTQLTALDNLDDVYALLRQFAREQSAQSTENCITG